MFAIAEGNPRTFIGMLEPLVRQFAETKRTIPRSLQARATSVGANRFRALLSTIPILDVEGKVAQRSLLTALDNIGDYFFRGVVLDNFSPEPALSFVVDDGTPAHIAEALGNALNAGAIIHISPFATEDLVLDSLIGQRFRLSYTLAPYYKLPLAMGKARILSSILAKHTGPTLFDPPETDLLGKADD